MTELISKIFIKNYKETENPAVRKSYGTLASVIGVIVNLILAGIKLLAGLLSGSVAIIADAFNNLSDAGSSIITFVSFKLSAKPADKEHPFGHARLEYVASMIVAFLVLLVGFELLTSSVGNILDPSGAEKIEFDITTVIILSVSIVLKLWLGLFYGSIGKKISSGVIKASGADSLSDSLSTVAVLVSGIIIKFTGWQIVDGIVGIGVSVLIIVAGAKILNETKNTILGEAPVDETISAIESIIKEFPEIIGMHDLLVHNYGPQRYIASLHAEVDGSKDIYMLHDMIDNAEKRIKDELGIACTIHLDPIIVDDEKVNEHKEFLIETMKKNGLGFNIHDFRLVIGETHTNLIFDVVLPFDSKISEEETERLIKEAVLSEREHCFCVITVDRE